MNRYHRYQNVNSYWYDEVPNHWKKTKNKYVFHQDKKVVGSSWEDHVLLTMGKSGVKPRDMDGGGKFPASFENYQVVTPNQIIFCLFDLDETPRTVGKSSDHGMITSAYDVFSTTTENDPQFWTYFYQMIDDHKGLRPYYTGLRKVVRSETFMGIEVFSPPYEEQKLISRYLDKKTSQIDSLVEKIQKKIELLKEQRTSLISHYVTKGLDPNVEMKDSGIEWIDEIPRHWTIVRLRFLCDIKTGGKDTQDNVENGSYPFFVRSPNVERINSFSFDGEAVLTSGDGAGVGKIFHYYVGKFDYHQRVYKFSNFKDVSGKYFYWFLKENFQYEILRWNAKSTVDSVRLPFLQNFPMVLPPIEEQENLLLKIDSIDDRVEKLIQRLMKKIDILKEYRQSLISSVVTGKVRVTEDMI